MYIYKYTHREKLETEHNLVSRLRFAVLLHIEKRSNINVMDCPKVKARLAELVDAIRSNSPSLPFCDKYMLIPGVIAPGFLLLINRSATSGRIISAKNNIYSLLPECAA